MYNFADRRAKFNENFECFFLLMQRLLEITDVFATLISHPPSDIQALL